MTEQEIADKIMLAYPGLGTLTKAEDQFSPFDYQNEKYLFEFKSRKTVYDPWMIEKNKLEVNFSLANDAQKDFIYVTESRGEIYIWNISKLLKNKYDFNFEIREAPISTELPNKKNGVMTFKQVGYIYNKDSKIICR
jgi:hypothetical protein